MKGCLIWVGARSLEVVEGDLLKERTHAIVNSAPESLMGGRGLDRSVKAAGGLRLLEECRKIGHCATGDAVITLGHSLKAKFVVHTVVPKHDDKDPTSTELLRSSYHRALAVALQKNLVSIAFPSLGLGVLGWPARIASDIGFEEILLALYKKGSLRQVRFVLLTQNDLKEHCEIVKDAAARHSLRVIDL